MNKVIELKEKSAKLVSQARAILDGKEVSKEQMSQADAMFADAKALRSNAVNLEEAAKNEAIDNEIEKRKVIEPVGKNVPVRESDEYRNAFYNNFIKKGSEKEIRALQTDAVTGGGYLVPSKQSNELIRALEEDLFIRRISKVESLVKASSLGIPTIDNSPADIEWSGEISTVAEDSTLSFGKREFKPHLLPKLIKISRNLIENGVNIENIVRDEFRIKFGKTEENAFLNGNGSGQPLGIFTASDNGIGTGQDVSTGNTETAFTANGLKECKYNLGAAYRKNAQWVFHPDAVKMLDKLKDGENRYIWQPSLSAGKPETLLGYPINESSYAPNTFTSGLYVGILGNFDFYRIVDALDIAVQVLYEKYATTNQIGYIFRKSTDGMPVLSAAFSRVKLA